MMLIYVVLIWVIKAGERPTDSGRGRIGIIIFLDYNFK